MSDGFSLPYCTTVTSYRLVNTVYGTTAKIFTHTWPADRKGGTYRNLDFINMKSKEEDATVPPTVFD